MFRDNERVRFRETVNGDKVRVRFRRMLGFRFGQATTYKASFKDNVGA